MRLLVFLIVPLAGCIDPVDLQVGPPERLLVVEGLVREGPGPHYVNLSRSGSFTQGIDALRLRERGARVEVLVGDGSVFLLQEVSGGRYLLATGEMEAVAGETYALRIELEDGSMYEAPPQTILASPPIDQVYGEVESYIELVGSSGVIVDRYRLALFADAVADEGIANYYRFMWSGTTALTTCPIGGACETCYQDRASSSVVAAYDDSGVSTSLVPKLRVDDFGLNTADGGNVFRIGYQLRVEQQYLSAQAYGFWRTVRDQSEDVGGLFDPPPEAVFGNVVNTADPRENVLGHFTVAGTAYRDVCIRASDYPDWPSTPTPFVYHGACGVSVPGTTTPPPDWLVACGS